MGLQFNHPWALLLLVPCGAFIWWMIRGTRRLTGTRKGFAITVRAVILLLLIAIAAGLTPYTKQEHRDVVFVADRSASVSADTDLHTWISRAIRSKGSEDRAGVVSFGLHAAVEKTLSSVTSDAPAWQAEINDSFSNVAGGLQLGAGLLEGGGKLVLLSDGEENAGDLLRQGRRLKEQGVVVDVVRIPRANQADAAVERLDVPAALKMGEKYAFEVTVSSTFAGGAELRLYEDDTEIAKETVTLSAGSENRFAFQNIAAEPGFHRYRAEIYSGKDVRAANNTGYAFSRIAGPPKVLIVEGGPGSSANMAEALNSALIPYDVLQPEQLPAELADYARYDSIILNDVPATRISEAPMRHLATAVSDFGIGLMMAGGSNSYGLGGYFKTPVERALPVYMDLKGKRQMPSLGLLLVIDKSGSMDGGKLELAKEAALRTVELLRDQDTVGVIAFDGSPWLVQEPVKLTERKSVMSAIQGIQTGGGTEIYPAVNAALERMLELNTQRKHIILLTDGQSAGNPGYGALTGRMVEKDITMSTVAVGDGADTALLEQLAKAAKGRYYFTNDQSTLPAIFSRETVLMSRTYIVENRFTPVIAGAPDWSGMFTDGVPPVDAYVATTGKETADTALLTPAGDPLLVRWQYGSGRTVAWTSDLMGKWAKDWTGWSRFPDVFVRWVKWTFPQFANNPYDIRAQLNGNEAELKITATGNSADAPTELKAGITGPDGKSTELTPVPVAPGEYSALLPVDGPGVYVGQIGGATAAFVIPYSPEYRLTAGDAEGKLEQLAKLTGGRVLAMDSPELAFRGERTVRRQLTDITRPMLIAALLLWLIDIALRRISVPWSRLATWFARLLPNRRVSTAGGAAAQAAPALAQLHQRKRRTGEFYAGGDAASHISSDASSTVRPLAAADQVSPAQPPFFGKPPTQESAAPEQTPMPSGASDTADSDGMSRLLAAKKRNRR